MQSLKRTTVLEFMGHFNVLLILQGYLLLFILRLNVRLGQSIPNKQFKVA